MIKKFKNNNTEIINIQYAILAKGKKDVEFIDFDESVKFGKNCHHNFSISTLPTKNANFGNNCYENIIFSVPTINLDNFKDRLKFCMNLLFNY